jgi:hypothetical protein
MAEARPTPGGFKSLMASAAPTANTFGQALTIGNATLQRSGIVWEVALANGMKCDLEHDRSRTAKVRIEVKSVRAGRPGHPMVRDLALCAMHAEQLREFGIDIVRF